MCLLVAQTIASEWLLGGGGYENDPKRLTFFPPANERIRNNIPSFSQRIVVLKLWLLMSITFSSLQKQPSCFCQSSVLYQKCVSLYVGGAVQRGFLSLRVFVADSGPGA